MVVHVMWEIQSDLSTFQSGQINSFNIPVEQSLYLILALDQTVPLSFEIFLEMYWTELDEKVGQCKITIDKMVGTTACTNITLYLNCAHNIPSQDQTRNVYNYLDNGNTCCSQNIDSSIIRSFYCSSIYYLYRYTKERKKERKNMESVVDFHPINTMFVFALPTMESVRIVPATQIQLPV